MSRTQVEILGDVCSNRHQGNEQSRESNRRNRHHREEQRLRVLELIRNSESGLSMKEVAGMMGIGFNQCSGRGSELKSYGLIEKTGEIRSGSAVLRATARAMADIIVVKAPAPEPEVTPMSPAEARKQFTALEDMYEHTEMSSDDYDAAKRHIYRALGSWGA